MAIEQRLEVKLLQKLILTPQLQQAIKLLQMPQLELAQTLNNELTQNPFLEESDDVSASDSDDNVVSEDEARDVDRDDSETPFDSLMNTGVDDYFDNRSYDGRDLGYFSPDNNPSQSFDQYTSKDGDLHDHLEWQIVIALFLEHVFDTTHIFFRKDAVAGGGSARLDESLALQKSQLRDRDVRVLGLEEVDDLPDTAGAS